ncbi:TPA: hypothetical protein DIU27_04955 [Candidatus Collierbacteria bacterium]|uniref:YdbS-like PH domain-containing protein n=1 Tax=Candidatus Collierbacteria bacterium GW2011_GWB2_44_22 TaxID=1618387 RepID=A0A0G1HWK9_9BACT|nr:MAG: hypothetical protein UW31_C0006G0034 [Candidatus Collierbacteria bacterium GW2011_GWA2_44_13]KKT51265.1 MAG: hypothetical protein UW42_C0004G0020 [Candidatus Collierbacteria bacterium GW2011_GWB1_44_197]KKT51315.1 MAG: hypothetical protein UW44_C0013G0035 [Candidatus Collierbacteria bacterium GW2011_GWB2_44_22]KKT61837.1 MAG: hypothetical protein UW56_C0017G0020 [Candidatus Collierbacteria bacterium GW2011_GWD1_44_27]KKT66561.1 MAG: hypothetical protein UW58_C0006G0024 [Candidatus Colli
MPEVFKAENVKGESEEIKKLLRESFSRSSFGSCVPRPHRFRFESQQDDETVLVLGRRHLVTNLGWIAMLCFASVIPFVWGEFPFLQALDGNTLISFSMLWYMGLIFFGIQSFLMWFYNVYIITNERLVDVDFVGLLSKTVNVAQISRIEDVNYTQKGILASFFNYGDVIIQTASEQRTPDTAGEMSAFTFEAVAFPDKVAGIISQLTEEAEKPWK